VSLERKAQRLIGQGKQGTGKNVIESLLVGGTTESLADRLIGGRGMFKNGAGGRERREVERPMAVVLKREVKGRQKGREGWKFVFTLRGRPWRRIPPLIGKLKDS